MPINTETLNRQLYKRLSKYKPKPLDAEGNVTPIEDEADVFKFTFTKDGEEYGNVFATVDDNHALTIYYSDDVTESPPGPTTGFDYDDSWTGLLKQLKSWAMHNQLSWSLKDKSRLEGDMARRNHMNKKDKISEGYHAMGKSRSYSDNIPSVKIVIEHSRQIEEGEQRYRNINKIFLENQMGERFLLDTKKPGIARVYARHIAEGGKVNDERWGHIQGLCEEYQKMAGFVRATRNGQFNESAQKLVNEAINHYQGLRESLSRMTGKRGYEAYFESWTPPLMEDDTDTSNLNELFVQETLDPRIESVMPILSKLQKNLGEMKEVNALAEWADSLIEGEGGPEASEEQDVLTPGDAGEGGAEDAPEDNLSEAPGAETLAHNEKTVKGNLDAFDLDEAVRDGYATKDWMKTPAKTAFHPSTTHIRRPTNQAERDEVAAAIKQNRASNKNVGINKTGSKSAAYGTDSTGYEDENSMVRAQQDKGNNPKTWKTLPSAGDGKGIAEEESLTSNNPIGIPEEEVDESALQAYLGNKKYGKDGMRKLQQLGREHASKATVAKAKAEYASEDVAEDLDANQKRVGQLGPTEKVKNNNIGKLVGANENFINTDAQAVVSEEETSTHKGGTVTKKDGVTKHKSAPGVYGGHDASTHPDSPEEKHPEPRGRKTGHDTDQIKKFKFSEGQDDLNAIKRLLGK
jgi:hypothetical protein